MKNNVISLKQLVNETVNSLNEQPQAAPLPKTPISKIGPENPERIRKQQLAKRIAKQIYDAKGVFQDAEYKAVYAIKQIPDLQTFYYTQEELRKLTGGRGIAQYLISFIDTGFFKWTDETPGSGPSRLEKTTRFIEQVVDHLTKIGVKYSSQTIKILTKYKSNVASSIQSDKHNMMLAAQIAGTIVGGVLGGPVGAAAVSGALGFADAKMYWDEGQPEIASLVLFFSLIPGLGLSKPLIKRLALKIAGKQALTKAEQTILQKAITKKAAAEASAKKRVAELIKSGKISPSVFRGSMLIGQFGLGALKYTAYGKLFEKVGGIKLARYVYDKSFPKLTSNELKQYWAEIVRSSERLLPSTMLMSESVSSTSRIRLTDIVKNNYLNEAGVDDFGIKIPPSDSTNADSAASSENSWWNNWVTKLVGGAVVLVLGFKIIGAVERHIKGLPSGDIGTGAARVYKIGKFVVNIPRWAYRKFITPQTRPDIIDETMLAANIQSVGVFRKSILVTIRNGKGTVTINNVTELIRSQGKLLGVPEGVIDELLNDTGFMNEVQSAITSPVVGGFENQIARWQRTGINTYFPNPSSKKWPFPGISETELESILSWRLGWGERAYIRKTLQDNPDLGYDQLVRMIHEY